MCPHYGDGHCRLAESLVTVPVLTDSTRCAACLKRHPAPTPETPGPAVASWAIDAAWKTDPALGREAVDVLQRFIEVLPRKRPQRAKRKAGGPGSSLKAALTNDGYPTCGECAALAAEMDRWGSAECERRFDEILERMLVNSQKALADSGKL